MQALKAEIRDKNAPPRSVRSVGRVLHMDKKHATFVWDHLAIVIWRGECDLMAVNRVEKAGMQAVAEHPGGIGLVGILEATAQAPSPAMRRASTESNDRMARAGLVGIAGVLSQTGFAGSIARGVITGMNLLSRAAYPFKVFQDEAPGVAWLATVLAERGERLDPVAAARAIAEYRAEYAAYWFQRYASERPPVSIIQPRKP